MLSEDEDQSKISEDAKEDHMHSTNGNKSISKVEDNQQSEDEYTYNTSELPEDDETQEEEDDYSGSGITWSQVTISSIICFNAVSI